MTSSFWGSMPGQFLTSTPRPVWSSGASTCSSMSLAGNDPNHQHQQHSSSSSAGPPSSPRYHQPSSAVASPAPSSPTSSPWPQTPHRQSLHHHQTPQPPALPTSPLRPESYYLNPTRPHPMGTGSMNSVPLLAASRRPFLDSPVSDSAVSPTPSPPPSVPPTTLSSTSDLIPSSRPSAVELLEDEDESMDDDDEEQIGPDDPRRFERRIAPSGQAYYVDHHLRTTAWELYKPRKQTLRRKIKYVREQVVGRVGRPAEIGRPCLLSVRRDDLLESACSEISRKSPEELRRRVVVRFEGEEGIDAGGLSREFFHLVSTQISDPSYGLFHSPSSNANLLSISPLSGAANPGHLDYFRVVGRLIGLALLNGERVGCAFAGVVWKLLAAGLPPAPHPAVESSPLTSSATTGANTPTNSNSRRRRRESSDGGGPVKRRRRSDISVEDLRGVDDELARSLEWVRTNDPSVLCRSFTHHIDSFGVERTFALRPNGESIEVTEENKHEYIEELARYIVLDSVRPQTEAMLCGVHEVVPRDILATLSPQELELLITGITTLSVSDWQAHTSYKNGLHPAHPLVLLFFTHLQSLTPTRRAALLQFATGSPRLPAGGFPQLGFTLALDPLGGGGRLPTSHTCFSELVLPEYTSQAELARALEIAVGETEGFSQT